MIEVLATGPLATIQDFGRPGHAALGVSPSGAADQPSLALANRLVGNAGNTPAIEATFGGLVLRAERQTLLAITGAPARATVDGHPVAMGAPFAVAAGALVAIDAPRMGVRTYLAVAGGFVVPRTFGSAATDTLGGVGPAPLRSGDRLDVGVPAREQPAVDIAPLAELDDEPVLLVVPGPRTDWFAADAIERLCGEPYEVRMQSDRVAVRLRGHPVERATRWRHAELPSEGLLRGAVQIPPDGQPIVFGPDHPVTGGYPVIAVVAEREHARVGQLRPGQRVRFRALSWPARP